MKKVLFALLAAATTLTAAGYDRSPDANVRISGVIIDSVTNAPVEFATIALMDPSTGSPVDGALADDKGQFEINKVAPGTYNLTISFIGFQTKVMPLTVEDRNIDLGTILISPVAQVLAEVTVEGQRAIIEERVDRTIYNAENDATARGGDATDVLKRVPMLSVDMDGNVSLRGNSNITVLINNKPSTIVASNIADALKQIPADEIKTVEVITSPSAKYDAEGSAGIINIVTKKSNLRGLTLGINSGVGLRGSNLGLNGNLRTGKMGFSLGGWGRANYNSGGNFQNEQLSLDPISGNILSRNVQQSSTKNSGLFGSYNLGWDYEIDEHNSLAASVRFGLRNNANVQDGLLNRQFDAGGALLGSSLRNADSRNESHNIDVSLNYTRLYNKPQRELSFQGLFSRNNQNSNFQNFILDESDLSVDQRIKNLNDSYNQEITVQADYQSPIGTNQMVEFGGKDIFRKAFSDYTYFRADGSDAEYVIDPSPRLNNNLNYDQNVMAAYLSYTLTTKAGYSLKAGSRYEHTQINAYSRTEENIEIPSYGVIVPSINVSKKLSGGNMIKAAYNRRIQRPSIRFLNPNIQASNPLNVTVGNPRLDPEYTNNYELSYSTFIKGTTLNFSGFFRNTNDGIQSIRDVIGNVSTDPDTIRTTYQNIGMENAYGMSVFANVTIGKLSLNGGTDVYYATLDNNNPDPLLHARNEGWVASGRIFGSYNLDKGWGLQFFSFMRGRRVELQGSQGGFYMYSLAVRKEFNERRGSIGIGAENFLAPSIKIRTNVESPSLRQESVNAIKNLSFRVNFSYRIGKMTLEDAPRRPRRSINNDDLKMGDDGMQMGADGPGNMPVSGGRNQRPTGTRSRAPIQQPTPTSDTTLYDPTGTWNFTLDSPQGGGGTLVINNEDGVYSGTIKTSRMPEEMPLTSVQVEGNKLTASYSVTFGGNTIPVTIDALITGGNMQGTMSFGEARTLNISGTKSN